MCKTVLLTGGAGFIGHHTVEHFLKKTNWNIIILDRLSYAGNLNRLTDIDVWDENRYRVKFFYHDFRAKFTDDKIQHLERLFGSLDYIIHMGAESHVDNSIENPYPFVESNVIGTVNMLELANNLYTRGLLDKFIYVSCYDKETRALTKEGLKYYWELKEGDIVFSINKDTKEIEEKKIERIIIQDYNGKMIHFGGKRTDLCVTPNHRMYYEKKNGIGIKEAQELNSYKSRIKLPNGEWKGRKEDTVYIENIGNINTKDLFYISGIFIGDRFTGYQSKEVENKSGYTFSERMKKCRCSKTGKFITKTNEGDNKKITSICNSWRVFIDIPESDPCRYKVEKTLTNLGIKWHKHKGKSGEHIYFSSKDWFDFFESFGKYAQNKNIPDWMLEFDKDYLYCLLNGLYDSDGCIKENGKYGIYTTVSEKLKDKMCELLIKLGFFPSFRERKEEERYIGDRKIKSNHTAFNITFGITNPSLYSVNNQLIEYNDKIWCVKVEDNKNLIVERNGKLGFCGNTDEVYGPAVEGKLHKEYDPHKPSNPYSASKAAGEDFCFAYQNTYRTPIIITRCHDEETLCWTENGFKQYNELKLGERVWTLNENEEFILESIQEVVVEDYEGDMIAFRNQEYDLKVTPNHRMLTKKRYGENKFNIKIAKDLLDIGNERHYIPLSGKWIGKEEEYIYITTPENIHFNTIKLQEKYRTDDLFYFLGFFISEGSISSGTVSISATEHKEEIYNLIKRLGFNPTIRDRSVVFSSVLFCNFLSQFGKGAKNKRIPSWVLEYSQHYLSFLYEGMMKGDGTLYPYKRYYTSSEKLTEDFTELVVKLGYSASIKTRETCTPNKDRKTNSFYVSIQKSVGGLEKKHISVEKYKGKIWCIRTRSGNFFVKRNGNISCSGNTMNNFGERQDVEKFVPKTMRAIMDGQPITIHCKMKDNEVIDISSRCWLHARNHADGLLFLLENGIVGEQYNIVGERIDVLTLAEKIANIMGKGLRYSYEDFHSFRPGHDMHYGLDGTKIKMLGWEPSYLFDESLEKTVKWMITHREWL